jgi:hypothetical protein
MNHTEATQYIKATLAAFGPGDAMGMTIDTWAKLHEAMSVLVEQAPVQELEKAAAMALDAIAASGDFLFNWHDCEPNNEREMDGYSGVLALNEKAFNALRKCLLTPAAQRQWVWLTDEDIEQEFGFIDELLRDCVHRTEAKVREKNNE